MINARTPLACALISSLLILASASSHAFVVVPTDRPDQYIKWGPSRVAGTGGGVVTWGFLAAGTPGSRYCGNFCDGESLDTLSHFYATPSSNNTTTPITLLSLQPVFQAAFDAWSAVADVQFRYIGVDSSLQAINDPTATSPMIRIGIWRFSGLFAFFVAGAASPPHLKSGSASGHIYINANVGYQRSTVPDNGLLQDFPAGGGLHMTDVHVLALHEIGHVIGLAGSDDPDSVMWRGNPTPALTRTYLRRGPSSDDIAGAQFLYGAPR